MLKEQLEIVTVINRNPKVMGSEVNNFPKF